MTRWTAYGAYLVGSLVFLAVALRRESPLLVVGSALFVLGTLLQLLREVGRDRRERSARAGRAGQ